MTRPTPEQVAARMKLPFSPGHPPTPKNAERLANARKLNAEAKRIEQSDTAFRDLAVRLAELCRALKNDGTGEDVSEIWSVADELIKSAGAKPC